MRPTIVLEMGEWVTKWSTRETRFSLQIDMRPVDAMRRMIDTVFSTQAVAAMFFKAVQTLYFHGETPAELP
jgi:hypothetical protein